MKIPFMPIKVMPGAQRSLSTSRVGMEAENDALHESLLQNIYDAAWITDFKGKILSVNDRAVEFFRYQQEEFCKLQVFNVVLGSDESLLNTIVQNLGNHTFTNIEGYCLRKDSSIFPAEIVANRMQNSERLCFFVRDITRRKAMEEELRKSEAKNRALLKAIPDLMFRVDSGGAVLDFKSVAGHPLEIAGTGMLGKLVVDVFPQLGSQFMETMAQVLKTGDPDVFEFQAQQQKNIQFYEVRIVASGEAEVLAIVRDITERKRAEEAEKERVNRDLEIAREIQQHLLPASFPKIEGIQIAAVNGAALKVGGDYYDIIRVDDNHWGFAIADVSGKGVSGALMMAIFRSALRTKSEKNFSPAQVLKEVNQMIQPDMQEDMFISVIYGVMDVLKMEFTFCRAGHEPLLVYRAKKHAEEMLNPKGMPLGLMAGSLFDAALQEVTVKFEKDDFIAFYTDGITEALNKKGQEFGRDQFIESLKANEAQPATKIVKAIEKKVRSFMGDCPQNDDITLMVLKF